MDVKNLLLKISTISFCAILISSTTILAASSTLLSYNGQGIRSRPSVSSFSLSRDTTITINHKQTLNTPYIPVESSSYMTVSLQKKGLFYYNDTGDNMRNTGTNYDRKTMRNSAGTYRLYFQANEISPTLWPSFDISGNIVS